MSTKHDTAKECPRKEDTVFWELVAQYAGDIIAEGKRWQQEGLTESEAAKMVIWGNKEGKSEVN